MSRRRRSGSIGIVGIGGIGDVRRLGISDGFERGPLRNHVVSKFDALYRRQGTVVAKVAIVSMRHFATKSSSA